jgi:hypothetical protein
VADSIQQEGRAVPLFNVSPSSASLTGTNPVRHGRGCIAAGLVVFGVLLAGLLSGCSTSVTYVGSSTQEVFFKVPNTWKVFSSATLKKDGLINPGAFNQAALQGESYPLAVMLSGPNPSVAKSFFGPYPWALAEVIALGQQDQFTVALENLKDEVFNTTAGEPAQQLAPTRYLVDGALRGTESAYMITSQTGALAFDQVELVNSATDKLWALVVGCAPHCFQAHKALLGHIVSTFVVKDQGN